MDTTSNSETPQRRVDDRAPAATINWDAPGAPAVPVHSEGAALPADLQQLKALALAITSSDSFTGTRAAFDAFQAGATPNVVLDLIARIERATAPHGSAAPTEAEKVAWAAEEGERHARIYAAGRAAGLSQRAAAPVSGGEQDERAEFEKLAKAKGWPTFWLGDRYSGISCRLYEAWLAGRAAVAAAKVPTGEKLPHQEPVGYVKDHFPGTDKAYRTVTWADRTFAMDVPNGAPLFAAPVEQGQGAAPECGRCEGRGHHAAQVAGTVADMPCKVCGGSGKAPVGAGVVPEGAKLVPSEPSQGMLNAGAAVFMSGGTPAAIYRAMLAATPTAATSHPVAADDQVRDQALEEVAREIDQRARNWLSYEGEADMQERGEAAEICAQVVRSFKSRTTAHGGAQGEA